MLQHFTSTSGTVSLLGIRIFTGRQHQIRAHCAHVGHPSLTDGLLDGLTSLKTKRLKTRKMGGFGDVFSHFSRGPFKFHACFQCFVFEIGRFDFLNKILFFQSCQASCSNLPKENIPAVPRMRLISSFLVIMLFTDSAWPFAIFVAKVMRRVFLEG